MAMPKKGSRTIVVDGATYRWRIRGRITVAQTEGEGNLMVAVEEVADTGVSTLLVDTSVPREWFSFSGYQTPITPAAVQTYIRLALQQGWKPTQKGKPFVLVADEEIATAVRP
jgi:hypothetical protein